MERKDVNAELKMNIIVKLDEFGYPSVTIEAVYMNLLKQTENFMRNMRFSSV
uniref:type I restriction enzyme endonuclease domain-containing protein n=1 Tax=Gelidibacter japonicus TaxID=1962232 RepID=UPI003D3556EF